MRAKAENMTKEMRCRRQKSYANWRVTEPGLLTQYFDQNYL